MIVAIIPARGGSKRIPRKNISPFCGKPMLAYSISVAERSCLFDGIFVSTEDDEIAMLAMSFGAEVIFRPPELAEIGAPDCGTQEVVRHALKALGERPDYACCIYPCTPMLTPLDLEDGLRLLKAGAYRYVYIAGQYYWGRAADFLKHPEIDHALSVRPSARHIDINTLDDWAKSEEMYETLRHAAH